MVCQFPLRAPLTSPAFVARREPSCALDTSHPTTHLSSRACGGQEPSSSELRIRLNCSWRGRLTIFFTDEPTIPGTCRALPEVPVEASPQLLRPVYLPAGWAATVVAPFV